MKRTKVKLRSSKPNLVLVLSLFISLFSFSNWTLGQSPSAKEKAEAERVWEQMVKSIGGRQKLHSITNLLLKKGDRQPNVQIELYVYPNRFWRWSKGRVVREYNDVSMSNVDLGIYIMASQEGIVSNKIFAPVTGGQNYREGWLMDACVLFLETRWAQPTPIHVRRETVAKERVNVIRTVFSSFKELRGWGLDFYLDPESSEVRRVVSLGGDGEPYEIVYFDGYTVVDGIKVPKKSTAYLASAKINKPKDSSYSGLEFKFNVAYNEELFTRVPTVTAGANAWEPKK